MKTKIIALLALGLFYSLISCNKQSDDDCPELKGDYFDVKSAQIVNYRQNGELGLKLIASTDTINFGNYVPHLKLGVDYVSQKIEKKSFSIFSNELYADCPVNGKYGSKEKLKKITFTTKFYFDFEHKENSLLNDIISIYSSEFKEWMTVEDFLDYTTNFKQEEYTLSFRSVPEGIKGFSMTVKVEFLSGEEYESTSDVIHLR